MTTYTPFLKLALPPFDTAPWDQAVNGNMTTIDAFISRYMAVPNYVGGWQNSTGYVSGQTVLDVSNATIYLCTFTHTSSAAPTTFAQDRAAHPSYWAFTTNVTSGNAVVTSADAPPSGSKNGDFWFDSVGCQLYMYYNDGNSMQWVVVTNSTGSIGEAPTDGNIYGRQRSTWVPASAGATGNVGRNLIHNSMFNIAQRGNGPWTASGSYTLDRWQITATLDTVSIVVGSITNADRAQIGDESGVNCLFNTFTGNAGATAQNYLVQKIEDVRRLTNKTVILSFWVKANTALKLGLNVVSWFGTGGASPAVWSTPVVVNINTNWTRVSATFVMPTFAGMTLGSNNDSSTWMTIWFSSGANGVQFGGPVGVQSGVVQMWGVQLEIAQPGQTQPTPLEKPDPELQLRQCQRFYQIGTYGCVQYASAGGFAGQFNMFPVAMRGSPTVTVGTTVGVDGNVSAVNAPDTLFPYGFRFSFTATAAGTVTAMRNFTASADL